MRRRLVVHLPVMHTDPGREVGRWAAAFRLLRPQTACECKGRLVFLVQGKDRFDQKGNQGQLHCVSDSLNDDGLGSRAEACSRHPRQVLVSRRLA
jgi:hypothetical protein